MDYPRKSGIQKTGPRPSTMHGFKYSLDPRQFSDKPFQLQCQKEIISYFQDRCPETPISIKNLQTPNTKDFVLIITTLVRKIDKAFELTGKPEDEVPAFFKAFGYPFVISKNSLLAVGAPSSWPNLLACLYWLMETVRMSEIAVEREIEEAPTRELSEEELYSEHLLRAYDVFTKTMAGKKEIEQLAIFLYEKADETHEKGLQVKEIIDMTRKEKDDILAYLKKAENIDSDLEMIRLQYNNISDFSQLTSQNTELKKVLKNLKHSHDERILRNKDLCSETDILLVEINQQKYNQSDLKRMLQELENQELISSQKAQEIKRLQDSQWKMLGHLNSLVNDVTNLLHEFNNDPMLCELGIIPNFFPEKLKNGPLSEILTPENFREAFQEYYNSCLRILDQAVEDEGKVRFGLAMKINDYIVKQKEYIENIKEKTKIFEELKLRLTGTSEVADTDIEKKKNEIRKIDANLKELKDLIGSNKRMIRDVHGKINMREKEFVKAENEWGNELKKEKKKVYQDINDIQKYSVVLNQEMRSFEDYVRKNNEEIQKIVPCKSVE